MRHRLLVLPGGAGVKTVGSSEPGHFARLCFLGRGGALALLLSISAITCSAPQDDHPDFTPDPPNVEMADPPNAAAEMARSPGVEARTECEWESGFRISPDSIGPLATTDPVGAVKAICPQAQYEAAVDFPLMRTSAPAIVIPIPGGKLSGTQPRRSSVEGLDPEQPVSVWYLTGDVTLPEGLSMNSTLGDLRRAYGGEDVYADIIDDQLSNIGVFFYRLRGMAFLLENLDPSALVRRNGYVFSISSSSVPDSATIRGVSVRGVQTEGVGRSYFPPHCGSLYAGDSFEDHLRCAELGEAIAQNNVAYAYRTGRGVPEDDTEAARWYQLAAEQGSAPGQFNLGRIYTNGEGVPEDLVYAYMWFDLSAAQGNRSAQRERDLIEQRMTREEIAEAQRLSREWTVGSELPSPDGTSSAPAPTADVLRFAPSAPAPTTEVLRFAPDECPPSPFTGEPDLWSEPDSVLLGAGLLLELQGCESDGDGWRAYSYEGQAPVLPYHIVAVHNYEDGDWIVVNAEGRRWQTVRSRPLFSPDGAWFATAWSDLEAGFDPGHLDIWAVEADSVRRVLALTGGLEWGAVDPSWVSANRIEYLRVSLRADPTSPLWLDTLATGVTRHDVGWVPDALPTSAR